MKNITKLTLDNVRVIEQNNQVSYYRKAQDCPATVAANPDGMFTDSEGQIWVMTQGVDRRQLDEISQEMCHLYRRRKVYLNDIREGSLLYSCDVKAQAALILFCFLVFEILSWVLIAGNNYGYWTAHGYAFAFIAALVGVARFVVVPLIDAWHDWRDAANEAKRLG